MKKNPSELFSHIIREFKVRNMDVSNYQYEAPKEQLSYNNTDSVQEAAHLQQLLGQSLIPAKITKHKM